MRVSGRFWTRGIHPKLSRPSVMPPCSPPIVAGTVLVLFVAAGLAVALTMYGNAKQHDRNVAEVEFTSYAVNVAELLRWIFTNAFHGNAALLPS